MGMKRTLHALIRLDLEGLPQPVFLFLREIRGYYLEVYAFDRLLEPIHDRIAGEQEEGRCALGNVVADLFDEVVVYPDVGHGAR